MGEDNAGQAASKSYGTRILTVTVRVPFAETYDFAHRPENFPKWRLRASSITRTEAGWIADTPDGRALLHFAPENEFGVLDHSIKLAGKSEAYFPLRMVQNGTGTQVELMLFYRGDSSDDYFEQETHRSKRGLLLLKNILESAVDR
jgi:hypothetical protein